MSLAYEAKAASGLEALGLTTARDQLDTTTQTAATHQWSYSHFLGYLLEAELAECTSPEKTDTLFSVF